MGWFSRKDAEDARPAKIDFSDCDRRPLLGHPKDCECVGNPYAHFPPAGAARTEYDRGERERMQREIDSWRLGTPRH